jgi:hypothetical protein
MNIDKTNTCKISLKNLNSIQSSDIYFVNVCFRHLHNQTHLRATSWITFTLDPIYLMYGYALQDLTVLPTEFFHRRKTHIPSVINLSTESPTENFCR